MYRQVGLFVVAVVSILLINFFAVDALLQGQANCPNCRTPWEFEEADAGEGSEPDAGEGPEPDALPMEADEQQEREDTPTPLW